MYEEERKPSPPRLMVSKGEDQISAPTDRIDDETLGPREEAKKPMSKRER
jgi:hypothetical protein